MSPTTGKKKTKEGMLPLRGEHHDAYEGLSPSELRSEYLIEDLFAPGEIRLVHWVWDRAVIGSAVPVDKPLELKAPAELRAESFTERRELGIANLGGAGTVSVDEVNHQLRKTDFLYIGRGRHEIKFSSDDSSAPARFYLVSFPAHAEYPVRKLTLEDAESSEIGSSANANQRQLHKFIRPGGCESCQLVMGFTEVNEGSVWNTMPAHTHHARSEIYLYFDLDDENVVFHFMGRPDTTRHVVVQDGQAVLSPVWSIHAGCGTSGYRFVWAMGGENQDFTDMSQAPIKDLR